MLIIAILLTTVVVGYIASLKRKRLKVYVYMLAAFLGACVGGALSFEDSKLLLDYPILNTWTVPIIFSVLAALVAVFTDRGKMIITMALIALMLAGAVGIVYIDSKSGNADLELLPIPPTELEREAASRLSEDECPCWDGTNHICLPQADCI